MKTLQKPALIVCALILFISATAAGADSAKYTFNTNMIKNLEAGLRSSNLGLKSSCIYFAGLYEIDELADDLIEVLNTESDSEIKTLITLSLYKIGTAECLKAISRLASTEKDVNLRKIGNTVLNQLAADSAIKNQ